MIKILRRKKEYVFKNIKNEIVWKEAVYQERFSTSQLLISISVPLLVAIIVMLFQPPQSSIKIIFMYMLTFFLVVVESGILVTLYQLNMLGKELYKLHVRKDKQDYKKKSKWKRKK